MLDWKSHSFHAGLKFFNKAGVEEDSRREIQSKHPPPKQERAGMGGRESRIMKSGDECYFF